jgi:SPP1 gp7 family putative phage head morphogenesis protein
LDSLRDEEISYAYDNAGDVVLTFPKMYAAYNAAFFGVISKGLNIKDSFDKLTNTDWWEQYMVNAFQFSAAKNSTEMRMLQQNVFDENKVKRSFSAFKNLPETQAIMDKFNGPDSWLRTEYDLASQGALMAERWQHDFSNKDINPYYIYKCADEPCEICEPLDGMIFRFDDDESSDLYPPNHFNCICDIEPTDEAGEDNKDLATDEEISDLLENVPEQFRGNVGKDGIFPRAGSSYYDTLPNANEAGYEMFKSSHINKTFLNITKYNDYAVNLTLDSWKKDLPTKGQDLVFRNNKWMLNVTMSKEVSKKISKKPGYENIRKAIESPSELYGRWVNVKEQRLVIMNYLLHDGKKSYIVETTGGKITNAYWLLHNDSKQLRKIGVKFIR